MLVVLSMLNVKFVIGMCSVMSVLSCVWKLGV